MATGGGGEGGKSGQTAMSTSHKERTGPRYWAAGEGQNAIPSSVCPGGTGAKQGPAGTYCPFNGA